MLRYFIFPILVFAASTAVAGPIVNVDGRNYEIEAKEGLMSVYRAALVNQVWFGNEDLARTFANALGVVDGAPNYGLYGPMFAYSLYEGVGTDYATGWVYNPTNTRNPPDNRAQVNNATAGNYYTYAFATDVGPSAIPEPGCLALIAVGAGLMVRRRRFGKR